MTQPGEPATPLPEAVAPAASSGYKTYLLTMLALTYALSYSDRAALGIMLQDIKTDLALSDTQLGLMSGIAFALFFSIMGIPIARWADRRNRVVLISSTVGLWGLMVSLCGFASSFVHLLLLRIGVAIGEAGCIPASQSLIADNFPRSERPRATSRFMIGAPLSVLIGFTLAGWLNQMFGWRIAFILLGLPGLLMAMIFYFTIREPRVARVSKKPAGESAPSPPTSVSAFILTLWTNRTFRHLVLFFTITSFFTQGIGKWLPSFLIRSFGMGTAELGLWFGLIYGVGAFVFTLAGGELASRYAANNERIQLRAVAVLSASCTITTAATYLAPGPGLALAFMSFTALAAALSTGPMWATVQTVVPAGMRAAAVAIIFFLSNLIGMGLGPLAVGVLSDLGSTWYGEESLRFALLALTPGYLWGAWHVWRAGNTVALDAEQISQEGV